MHIVILLRGGSRIFEKGGGGPGHLILRSTSKKRAGSRRGSIFGPNVKKPSKWPKMGGGGGLYIAIGPRAHLIDLDLYGLGLHRFSPPPPPGRLTGSFADILDLTLGYRHRPTCRHYTNA